VPLRKGRLPRRFYGPDQEWNKETIEEVLPVSGVYKITGRDGRPPKPLHERDLLDLPNEERNEAQAREDDEDQAHRQNPFETGHYLRTGCRTEEESAGQKKEKNLETDLETRPQAGGAVFEQIEADDDGYLDQKKAKIPPQPCESQP
jgi:hypothetical protein